jgi:iron complex transport system substrate-binding protein
MQPLTDEAMVAADPDLILVMTDGLASVGGVDGLLAAKPAIALTAAGQHRRLRRHGGRADPLVRAPFGRRDRRPRARRLRSDAAPSTSGTSPAPAP